MTELLAVLCGEPWCYSPQEAGKLTYYQIGRILYSERDERGRVQVRPKAESQSAEERFARAWSKRGLPRWRIAELWRERLREADPAATSAG